MNELKGKNIVVIGGAGFIGSHLAEALQNIAQSLIILDAFIENSGAHEYNMINLFSPSVQLIRENLENIEQWGERIRNADMIFDLASVNAHKESMRDPFMDYQHNAAVHLKLIRYCTSFHRPVKIIFTSSRSVYGAVEQNPANESTLCMPRDFYSLHTLFAEHYFRLSCNENIRVCCVRFSNTFGPRMRLRGQDIGLYGELLRSALTGQPMEIYGTGNTLRDTLFIDNLIVGLMLIAGHFNETFKVVNLGGISLSIRAFAQSIQKYIPEAMLSYIPIPDHLRFIQVGDVILDNTLAKTHYHWTPELDLDTAIRQTVEFYQANKDKYL